ncbi:MAG: hypothetical protein AAF502_15955 [Bacteroidota bacterium]
MSFEPGDVVIKKDSDQKMTVLRLVGDDENDAMNMMDHQLSSKGFVSGSPMCEWFEGTVIKTATFHIRDLEKFEEKATPEPAAEEPDTGTDAEEEDFDFDDEDFDF